MKAWSMILVIEHEKDIIWFGTKISIVETKVAVTATNKCKMEQWSPNASYDGVHGAKILVQYYLGQFNHVCGIVRLTKKSSTAILIPFFTWVLESELLVSVSNRHFQRADSNFFCMFVTVSLLVCICVFLSVSLTLRVLFCVWRQDALWVRLQKVGACRWQPSTRWQITTQLRQTLSHTNYTK